MIGTIHAFARRADVDRVHVVAHSQGTPIAYETLYHYLPGEDRRKVWTLVTAGSVLNYYHQIDTVLDHFSVKRFPVRADPGFPPQYRWINVWNSGDPIPEFRSLEGYGSGIDDRGPTNVKSLAHKSPVSSHTGYWTEYLDVHMPLIRRLLGDLNPDEWSHPLPSDWQSARTSDAEPSSQFDLRHSPSDPWWRSDGPRRPRGWLARWGHPVLTFSLWMAGLLAVFAGSQPFRMGSERCFADVPACTAGVTAVADRIDVLLEAITPDDKASAQPATRGDRVTAWLLETVPPSSPASGEAKVFVHGPEVLNLVLTTAGLILLLLARAPLTALISGLIYEPRASTTPASPAP